MCVWSGVCVYLLCVLHLVNADELLRTSEVLPSFFSTSRPPLLVNEEEQGCQQRSERQTEADGVRDAPSRAGDAEGVTAREISGTEDCQDESPEKTIKKKRN